MRFRDLGCEHRAGPVSPDTNRFVADINASFVQQVFDVPERKREADIHHCGEADDLGAGLEVAKGGAFRHIRKLSFAKSTLEPSSPDGAHASPPFSVHPLVPRSMCKRWTSYVLLRADYRISICIKSIKCSDMLVKGTLVQFPPAAPFKRQARARIVMAPAIPQKNACNPVCARPRMSACTSWVPS